MLRFASLGSVHSADGAHRPRERTAFRKSSDRTLCGRASVDVPRQRTSASAVRDRNPDESRSVCPRGAGIDTHKPGPGYIQATVSGAHLRRGTAGPSACAPLHKPWRRTGSKHSDTCLPWHKSWGSLRRRAPGYPKGFPIGESSARELYRHERRLGRICDPDRKRLEKAKGSSLALSRPRTRL